MADFIPTYLSLVEDRVDNGDVSVDGDGEHGGEGDAEDDVIGTPYEAHTGAPNSLISSVLSDGDHHHYKHA